MALKAAVQLFAFDSPLNRERAMGPSPSRRHCLFDAGKRAACIHDSIPIGGHGLFRVEFSGLALFAFFVMEGSCLKSSRG